MTRARTYESYMVAASILEYVVTVCLLLWLLSGASISLRNMASSVSSLAVVLVGLYGLGIFLLVEAATLPFSLYRGFSLPRSMGLLRESFGGWAWDTIKGWALGLILGTALIEALYALFRSFPSTWWILAGLGAFAFMVFLAVITPTVFLPIFFTAVPLRKKALRERVRALAKRAGVRIRGVYEFDLGKKTRAANAALMGIGKTRRIILSDTLIKSFTPSEIDTVLAHEMGHHKNRHLWKGLIVNGVTTLVGLFIVNRALVLLIPRFSYRGLSDVANLPLIAMIIEGLGLIAVPLFNTMSRRMERSADIFALRLTGRTRAFVSTMKKLARLNLSNSDPHPVVEFLFYTHPPIRKRLALAQSLSRPD